MLCSDVTLDSIVDNNDLLLSLLLATVDESITNEGDADSDLSEDSLTLLWSDGTLKLTIEGDKLLLSLLTLKVGKNPCDKGDTNTDLSADDSPTVLCSKVLLETILKDGDTPTPLLTPTLEDFTTDDAASTNDLSEES